MNTRHARLIAGAAFILGVAASVAANVAHARPELGPRLASAFAPVALLLTVEIMSRAPWPAGRIWALGRWAGTGAVAAVAAITSYRHMAALLLSYGEDRLTALIQPACVDGLMVVASLALLALGKPAPAPAIDAPTPKEESIPTPAVHVDQPQPAPSPVVIPDRISIPAVGVIRPTRLNGVEVVR